MSDKVAVPIVMDLAALLTTFLSQFFPHLLKLGQPIAEEAGKQLDAKLGEGTWETAKAAFGKLAPKVSTKPLARGAAGLVYGDLRSRFNLTHHHIAIALDVLIDG